MTVEIVVGYGVRLGDLPDVTFARTRDEVLAAWSGRHWRSPFVCGAGWSVATQLAGVEVGACGLDDTRDGAGRVGLIWIERVTTFHRDGVEGLAPHEPVVLDDVDLFGWPAEEIVDYLRACGRHVTDNPGLTRIGDELVLMRDTGRFTSVTLFEGPRS